MEAFEGRVYVAASNSPDSVTISGDADAIQHVQGVLQDESTSARLLKVDKAYDSHHMLPCAFSTYSCWRYAVAPLPMLTQPRSGLFGIHPAKSTTSR